VVQIVVDIVEKEEEGKNQFYPRPEIPGPNPDICKYPAPVKRLRT
jgi:hypothetical protein